MVKLLLSGYTMYLRLRLGMKGFDAIRPGYNCFILMTISDPSVGFSLKQLHAMIYHNETASFTIPCRNIH